jgi:hypothetical protein
MPVLAVLGHAPKPPVEEGHHAVSVQYVTEPRKLDQFLLVAAPRPAAVTPQQVTVDGGHGQALGGVGVALGVVQHLLVAPGAGSLYPGRQPVDHDRLAGAGHLPKALAQLGEGGDEGAVGLAEPQRGQLAQQQVHAVADLGLGDPDHPAGASVRQPVQDHRRDSVQSDLQGKWRVAAHAGWAGW